jgi:hypothetical protein
METVELTYVRTEEELDELTVDELKAVSMHTWREQQEAMNEVRAKTNTYRERISAKIQEKQGQ